MAPLAATDVSALLEFLKSLYGIHDVHSFRRQLISSISSLVSSEITTYNEVNYAKQQHACITYPPGELEFRDSHHIFDQHIPEHPLIGHYAQTSESRALKISDFLTKSRFHRTGLYADFYRRVGVEHQMAFLLPATRPMVVGIALNRSHPDFSERDRLLLNLVRPHLDQAYRNAEAVTRMSRQVRLAVQALEHLDAAVMLVSRERRVLLSTNRAMKLLAKYFPDSRYPASQLPDILKRWIRCQEDSLNGRGKLVIQTPLIVDQEKNRLIARLLSDAEYSLLILMEQAEAIGPEIFLNFGLTRREAEVLSWVAEGKTNAAIASILGLSPRTVQKHLEHIFQRLGVETRTAAAAWALQTRYDA